MRRGYKDVGFIKSEGDVIGVNLGWDFVAEHEWGIEKIRSGLGIPSVIDSPQLFGLKGRTVGKVSDDVLYFEKRDDNTHGTRACLVFTRWEAQEDGHLIAWKDGGELESDPESIATAWSESDFGVVVSGKDEVKFLEKLYKAFKEKNVVVFLGGRENNPFSNSGLCLCIASMLPKEVDKNWAQADASHDRLKKAVTAMGIKEKLKEAGRDYFALSPRWADEDETEIKFWLNPYDQRNNNACWCTEQDLLDWIAGKGKIPKNKE